MLSLLSKDDGRLVELLRSGGLAVLRTDTLYGLVAKAADQAAVERLYRVKQRAPHKPYIILIADIRQLYDQADIDLDDKWPGPNSLILPSPSAPDYLRRGGETLAYRLPADKSLRQLIEKIGPLVAPSANPEGQPPARSIIEARAYFGNKIDAYVDEGEVTNAQPSALWSLDEGGLWQRLR